MTHPIFPAHVPLVWSNHDTLHVGLNPGQKVHAVPGVERALRQLDGQVSLTRAARAARIRPAQLRATLAQLDLPSQARRSRSVTVIGQGTLADIVARSLSDYRIHRLAEDKEDFPSRHVIWATGRAGIDLEVIVRAREEHRVLFPIIAREDGIDVGPISRADRRGCPACLDAEATATDPSWAHISAQLPRQQLQPSTAESMFAAGFIGHALTRLTQREMTDLDGVRWGVTQGRIHRLCVTPHARCVCATTRTLRISPISPQKPSLHNRPGRAKVATR